MIPAPIIIVGAVVFVSALIDWRTQKIPNLITFPSMLGAMIFHCVDSGFSGLGISVAGLLLGMFLFSIPFVLNGMGAGDAKLLGVIGAWVGPSGSWQVFLYTAIAGAVYAIIVVCSKKEYRKHFFSTQYQQLKHFFLTRKYLKGESDQSAKNGPKLCYGLAIAAGTFVYILKTTEMIHYFS